ncbi:MAG: hypothetical protein WC869_06175 [Phycisphaerae bacterium]|jgi:hypothetical protein
MRNRTVQVVAYCVTILCLLSLAPAQPSAGKLGDAKVVQKGDNLVEVTVTGQGGDKDEAVRDAQRKAVENGAGTYIYSQSQTKDFALVRDTVLARSAGFVQSFEVLSGKEVEDGLWEVKIKAVVSIKGIEDTWGVVTNLLQQMGRPKIMVFISEKIGDEVVEDSTVQSRIENRLLESGFLLVDRNQLKEIDKKDLQAAVAEDSPGKVQAIAKRFGAQVFITGSAHAAAGVQKQVNGVLLYTYEAEANIKCYRSDTAQLLSSIPGAATRGVQQVWRSAAKQALDAQAQDLAPRVTNDILRFWMDVLSGRGEVQLEVDGVSFGDMRKLKDSLKAVKGVSDVNAQFHNNVAECSIQADSTAEVLAERIAQALPNLNITDVSGNVIKAKFTAGN